MTPLHRSIFKEMNQIADQILSTSEVKRPARPYSTPPAKIKENESAYVIQLLAAGRKKEDFKITIEKDLLTFQTEEVKTETSEQTKILRNEFSLPALKRVFTLDETIDADSIQATYSDGILSIQLNKKTEPAKEAKHITVT